MIGTKRCELKAREAGSLEWAGLEKISADGVTVAQFIDALDSHAEMGAETAGRSAEIAGRSAETASTPPYLFDWSLPQHCPELLNDFVVPRYFAQAHTHHDSIHAFSAISLSLSFRVCAQG